MFNYKKKNQLGVSLIEVIISLGLGVIVLVGASQAMLNMTMSSKTQAEKNNLDQTANLAFSYIGQKVRNSLAAPCERIKSIEQNKKLKIHSLSGIGVAGKIDGHKAKSMLEEHGFIIDSQKKKIGNKSESLTDNILFLSSGNVVHIKGETGIISPKVTVSGSNPFDENERLFVLSTCDEMDVFKAKIDKKASVGVSGETIFIPDIGSGKQLSINYRDIDSALFAPLIVSKLSINNSNELNEQTIDKDTTSNVLLDNVEAMRILFGVDSKGNDGLIDKYISANQLAKLAKSEQIISIDVYLLIASDSKIGNIDVADSYTIELPDTTKDLGDTISMESFTFTDNVLRGLFKRTITLRNTTGI